MTPTRRPRRAGPVKPSPVTSAALTAGTVGLAVLAAPAAQAATFNVTNLNDTGAGSLRDAINTANASAGADVITFQPGLTGTITLTSGQLLVSDSVDIQGPGAAAMAVSGNNASRVFYLYNSGALLDITISDLTVRDGAETDGAGIMDADENLTLDGVVVTGNHATNDGGGLWMDGFNFSFTIRNSTFSGNTAGDAGGGIYVEDTNDDNIANLFQDSTISGNSAYRGGGIYFYDPDSPVTIDRTTISGNTASDNGGGLLLLDTDTDGSFVVSSSTISGNSAVDGGGAYFYQADQPVTLRNVTVSGNQATGSGGGLFFYDGYSGVDLQFVTVVSNSAAISGGGVYLEDGNIDVTNSIVANNTAPSDADLAGAGTFTVTYSLVEASGGTITDGGNNITGTDPDLGPLADNGGPTDTHLPNPGSPVIDSANLALTPGITTDQRGVTRPAGPAADMGAVEVDGGTVAFSLPAYSVNENAGTVTVTVTRTGGTDPAEVDYATAPGTATAGADYTTTAGTLTFAAGQTSQSIIIPILDDAIVEAPETFTVTLANPESATLGAPATTTVTINDVENGSVQFSSPTYTVSEDGGSLTVTVTRTGGSTGSVTVDYSTSSGTATSGADFTATSGTITFLAGDSTPKTFNVPILPDALAEGPENFALTLTNPTGGVVLGATPTAVATIDDAVNGSVQFNSATYTVNEDGGFLTVTVTRSGGSSGSVSVNYATSSGTATSGADFTPTSGTITFLAGDTAPKTFNVPILPDALIEGPENFVLTLSNPTGGATLGATATAVATINDATIAAAPQVPVFGPLGRLLLIFSTSMIGLFMTMRKRLFGFLFVLILLGATSGSLTAATRAVPPVKAKAKAHAAARNHEKKAEKIRGVIATVTTTADGTVITFTDKTSVTLGAAPSLVVRDLRAAHPSKGSVALLRAGQTVVVRLAPKNSKRGTRIRILQ